MQTNQINTNETNVNQPNDVAQSNMQNNLQNNVVQNPYINNQPSQNAQTQNSSFLSNFNNADFIKGALIGAAIGYVLTNEKAQKAIMKTVAKGSQMLQMGVEEMKERFEDAKAEMNQ